ncbi:hypothetical protein P7C70_g7343, partial [Phenoliferia sp. Uapishka_3]
MSLHNRLAFAGLNRRAQSTNENHPPVASNFPSLPKPIRGPGPARSSVLQSLDNLLDPSPAVPLPKRRFFKSRFQHSTPAERLKEGGRGRQQPPEEDAREHPGKGSVAAERGGSSGSDRSLGRGNGRKDAWGILREEANDRLRLQRQPASSSVAPTVDPSGLPALSPPKQSPILHPRPPLKGVPTTAQPSPRPPSSTERSQRIRLSTHGLNPIRHHLRSSGTIEILSGPKRQLVLDVRDRGGGVLLISADGELISVFDPSGNSKDPLILFEPIEVFDRDTLPTAYEKMYSLAIKFVDGIRATLPKLIFHSRTPTLDAKHTIFSDSPPTYELSFPTSSTTITVRVDRRRSLIRIFRTEHIAKAGLRTSSVKLSLDEKSWSSLGAQERNLVEVSVGRAGVIDQMNEAYERSLADMPPQESPPALASTSTPLPSSRASRHSTEKASSNSRIHKAKALSAIALAVASPPPPPAAHSPHPASSQQHSPSPSPGTEQNKRCLPGAGWIIREQSELYRVLFCDGEELVVDTKKMVLGFRRKWYAIGVDLPTRVKGRLALAKEMMELF